MRSSVTTLPPTPLEAAAHSLRNDPTAPPALARHTRRLERYLEKKKRLAEEAKTAGGNIGLNKNTSNLFRDRSNASKKRLNVKDFTQVLAVDATEGWVDVEGMTTYADLVDATLEHGMMPTVVPQLKSITIGGAVSGVGIESSSFKYGLVHETVQEMEILQADGRTLVCTPDNEHKRLFFGFPNSYGTLGYALRLKVKCIPVRPYVRLSHYRYTDPDTYFKDVDRWCNKEVDFVDGTVFSGDEMYLTIGEFCDDAPRVSDYTYLDIYYRSLREKQSDYLTTKDYIWRWDTDWFWCSKHFYVQNPLMRRIVGKSRLNSTTYTGMMRWNSKWGLTRALSRVVGTRTESVIQDVDIPIENAPEFLRFFQREIGIKPVWICPIRVFDATKRFSLYKMDAGTTHINFGFWDVVKTRERLGEGHFNRLVERKVIELGGIKSLYSDAYFSPEEFWRCYDRTEYEALKAQYDPGGLLQDLYAKCVLKR